MTQLLASVRTIAEASMALEAGADIIDLKDPAEGALGALPLHAIHGIAAFVSGSVQVSATIGDLPLQAQTLVSAVKLTADQGVDIIKVGFFGGVDQSPWITALQPVIATDIKIVAVLFVEQGVKLGLLPKLRNAGFYGVMLDTARKNGKSLRDYVSIEMLKAFLDIAHQNRLQTGLAGSLRLSDIPALALMKPGYLGFRGALCRGLDRRDIFVKSNVVEAKRLLRESNINHGNAGRA